eukprot:TRINITY_DN3300_c0_g1_i1.p1 TRINITY_DN3300_c0_g1~~TRINITY_DN3300_c0_g1_i1.p1  ORF type:complete len:1002 (+),score=174.15 TRINITY_DN3300_c0_g1_i1:215-3220(+)
MGVIGPSCSVSAEVMLFVTDIYEIPVISASCTSPTLSDSSLYPNFNRVVNSDVELAPTWMKMVDYYHMKSVAVLYSSENVHSQMALEFIRLARAAGITVYSQSFVGSVNAPMESEILVLRDTGTTNFFLASYTADAITAFKTAYAYGLTGRGSIWIGNDGWSSDDFSKDDPELAQAVLGSIVFQPTTRFTNYQTWKETFDLSYPNNSGSMRIAYTYDAVYVYARALHNLIENDSVPFSLSSTFKSLLHTKIMETNFNGITGTITFDENGDRTGVPYDIYNFQTGGLINVGFISGSEPIYDTSVIWPGNISTNGISLPPTLIKFATVAPYSGGFAVGNQVVPAALLAAKEINANPDILPNFYLEPEVVDSECSGRVGLGKFVEYYEASGKSYMFVVGGGCSVVSQPLAQFTATTNMSMISWGSTSPSLSDKDLYPFFLRTVPPDTYQGRAWYILVKHFGWTRVATINSNEDLHALLVKEFTDKAENDNNLQIITQEVFPGSTIFNISSQLKNIQSKGARIILLACYQGDAVQILEQAYGLGMTGQNGYIWIGTDSWFSQELIEIVQDKWQGIIGLTPSLGTSEKAENFWNNMYAQFSDYTFPKYTYTETIYDATYAYAYALHSLLEVEGQSYFSSDRVRGLVFDRVKKSEFEGVNGQISFNDVGDRVMNYDVLNLVGEDYRDVGLVNSVDESMTSSTVYWGTGLVTTPSDSPIRETVQVSTGLIVFFLALAGIGLLGTIGFTVSLIHFRKHEVFVAARVIFCAILLVCGILAYSYVFLNTFVSDITCWLSPWFFHVPLVLALACILSKAWRVYLIFIKNKKKLRVVKITDERLLLWISVFLTITILYLLIAIIFNPYVATFIENENNPEEQFHLCMLRDSDSVLYYWPVVLFIAELVLIFVSAILGYLTRKVELLHYNESSFLGICAYNLFFTAAILVPLTALIPTTSIDAQYAIQNSGVLLNIYVFIFYFFISRLLFIKKGVTTETLSTTGTGTSRIRKLN